MQPNILILALGNLLMGDDGMGIRALELLQDRYDLPPGVNCVDGGVLGLELLAHVEGVTDLLVIDAVQTGQEPGGLVRLEGEEIPKSLSLKFSMHQISFADILALSLLRGTIPPRLVVWGIIPASLESGVGLSQNVEEQLNPLVDAVIDELQQWGVEILPRLTPNLDNPKIIERISRSCV
jgi:hydrogenase maturation protease